MPGHGQFPVPSLINLALWCRAKAMEVGLWQQGIAAASCHFSFGRPGQRAGGEQGCVPRRSSGWTFLLPHLLRWVFPFVPCFSEGAKQPSRSSSVSICLSPTSGSPAGGRASPRGTAGA